MRRNFKILEDTIFDILVIGGGIHGACVVYEAARRGLKAALIEKNDFAHATSSNSLKIIHGGLRYLQHANLKRMRHSIYSRKQMIRMAPHLMKPVGFVVPTHGKGMQSRFVLGMAIKINDLISFDRNWGIPDSVRIPNGRMLNSNEFYAYFPNLTHLKLTGAALWYEIVVQNTERLVLEYILSAQNYGAVTLNYIEALDFIFNKGKLQGVKVQDNLTKQEFQINAKVVVSAAGPWMDTLLSKTKSDVPNYWAKAVNIIVNKPLVKEIAIGLEGVQHYVDQDAIIQKGKRLFFFVPWKSYTMIGTTYKHYDGEVEKLNVQEEDFQELLQEVNQIFPGANLTKRDIVNYHIGLLPAVNNEGDVQLLKNSHIFFPEETSNLQNVIFIKSVKFTTAPYVAKQVIEKGQLKGLFPKHSIPTSEISKRSQNALESLSHYVKKIPRDIVDHLFINYGMRAANIMKLMKINPEWAKPLSSNTLVTAAEVNYCIEKEMAFHLVDLVFRRLDIATKERPDDSDLRKIAFVMGEKLGWRKQDFNREIQQVLEHFEPLESSLKSEILI